MAGRTSFNPSFSTSGLLLLSLIIASPSAAPSLLSSHHYPSFIHAMQSGDFWKSGLFDRVKVGKIQYNIVYLSRKHREVIFCVFKKWNFNVCICTHPTYSHQVPTYRFFGDNRPEAVTSTFPQLPELPNPAQHHLAPLLAHLGCFYWGLGGGPWEAH